MKIPKRLYKYQKFSELTLQGLKTQTIYFGPPRHFNDPYDCSLSPSVKPQSNAELEKFRVNQLQRGDLPDAARLELQAMSTEKISEVLVRNVKQVFSANIEQFQKNCGVSCFSETNDNLLMWSHYAGHGKGICLEFNTAYEPVNKPLKVEYSKCIPEIDPVLILEDNNFNSVLSLYTTKSEHWSYEREWRVIHKLAGTKYVYPAEALKSIYFGTELAQESIEIICLIIQGQNPNVKFFKGKRSTTEYRVEFEEFTYTNYSSAKQQGVVT